MKGKEKKWKQEILTYFFFISNFIDKKTLRECHHIQEILTYKTGRPVQLGGSNTFNKDGIPSVGIAPAIKATNIISSLNIEDSHKVTKYKI